MTEAELQANVIELARYTGWMVAHFRAARVGDPETGDQRWVTPVAADGKGFPDLVLVDARRGQILYRELKSPKGRLSPHQQKWLDALTLAGADAGVWRPADWPLIEETLNRQGRARR